jgi:CRISPR-associated protein Cmr3
MTSWIIEPREAVIVRDGRPFSHQPGIMAATLPFPFPSTTAGAARSRAGSKNGVFQVEQGDLLALKKLQIRGPLLAELNTDERWQLLVPAPGDALLLEQGELLHCRRLTPVKPPENAQMMPFKNTNVYPLWPIGQTPPYDPAKPAKRPPAFWHWDVFVEWLLRPEQRLDGGLFSSEELGIQALPQEERVHVALERGMMVASEGALFETRGLEFTHQPDTEAKLQNARHLALWLDVEQHKDYQIQPGLDSLGGERRLVSWQASDLGIPEYPEELCKQIEQDRFCRLILLTPAYFQQGYLPDVTQWAANGVTPELHAALVGRPQVVSGWDIEKNCPKPTQRLAPAGSVFFLKLTGEPENIRAWVAHTWMKCLNEDKQRSNDGFGLAVLGTWDGEPRQMSQKEDER